MPRVSNSLWCDVVHYLDLMELMPVTAGHSLLYDSISRSSLVKLACGSYSFTERMHFIVAIQIAVTRPCVKR